MPAPLSAWRGVDVVQDVPDPWTSAVVAADLGLGAWSLEATMSDALIARARAWMARDPDPVTRAATEAMLGDPAALAAHFEGRLTFGTAGMRGAMGPGPQRMNQLMVRRVTAAVAQYLRDTVPDQLGAGVVVGFDGRHGSREFAAEACGVLAAAGIPALTYDDVVPTPQLAHAVKHLGAAAGIMVTASHNPPQDNGYKVYWGNGAQIVPPHDTGISACLDALADDVALDRSAEVPRVPVEVLAAYLDEVLALRVHESTGARIVYSAMHGVGTARIEDVMGRAGHADLHLVAAQAMPDADFPTVNFPNPEEPGAMDLSLALAREVGADVAVANDPDADRLAVAVRYAPGAYRMLTGNQVGVLLADDLLEYGEGGAERLVATTIVSTSMLSRIAARHGVQYAETLTGFKWIANKAITHDAAGGQFVVGFEEALGYSAGSVVRDKDGVSAALLIADLASWAKWRGETLLDRLEQLYRKDGVYASGQLSATFPGAEGAARIASVTAGLRADPPAEIAGVEVVVVRDISTGEARDTRTGETTALDLPSSDVLAFDLADGSRVLARPSGTEPKIKIYFEARTELGSNESLADAEERAAARVAAMRDDMAARTGLT
jgi:phosphomannomutase